jgi:penicillin-binding protein 1C
MRLRRLIWLVLLLIGAGMAAGGIWVFNDLPSVGELPTRLQTPSVRITDRHGHTLYEVLPEQGGRHAVLFLDQTPLVLRQATIATEDQNFYHNPGVDWKGILRSLWINLQGRETLAGGSTITQQVARNLLMEQEERAERSLRRKLREIALAFQLTRQLGKDEILALYMNQTYYGGMAYGVEAAAQTYFGKPASLLDLAESAMLAGLPQAPALYNPFTDFQAAKARQKDVLALMEKAGFITSEQRTLAENQRLVLVETPYPIEAPHFVMMGRAELDRLFTPEQIFQYGGLVVRTTLDLDWQKHAEQAVQRQLESLQISKDGLGHNVNSLAMVALNPDNGDILALVGSPDYFDDRISGAINMALAPRQPGSALKPLVYAVALTPPGERRSLNLPWTAATMLLDVRASFFTRQGQAYTPENYDLRQHGPVLLREALASSLNIPAVLTLDHIGLPALFELTSTLGVSTLRNPQDYDLSLALGGGEVRLLDLTAAYGAFANGGYRVTPRLILEVSDFQGQILYQAQAPNQTRVIDERVAWLISDILSDNDARRRGFGENSILRLDRPAAVKTGTTTNFHDNWTVGYTPELVVGVWAGNTDYQPMRGVNGLSGAAPVWHQFMRTVLRGQPVRSFTQPKGFMRIEVCALSGLLPTAECPYRRFEWFIDGTQPLEPDYLYRKVVVDRATGRLADANTPPERWTTQVVLDLPLQAQAWARTQGYVLWSDLMSANDVLMSEVGDSSIDSLQIVAPASGSIYLVAPGFSADAQRILIEAVAQPGVQEVTLWLDDQALATFTQAPFRLWWALTVGEHRLWATARLADGSIASSVPVTFVVQD